MFSRIIWKAFAVFEFQLAMFQSMTEMTQSLSSNYAKALDDVWGAATTAKPGGSAAKSAAPCDKDAASAASDKMAMPKIPQSGRSWYKPPSENPVLVFWDEMLKPWRTMMPGGNAANAMSASPIAMFGMVSAPGLAGYATPSGPFQIPGFSQMGFPQMGEMPKFASAPLTDANESLKKALDDWSSVWQALLTPPTGDASPKAEGSTTGTAKAGSELDAVTESWKTLIAFHSNSGMAMARVFFPDHTVVTMQVPLPTMPFVPTSGMPDR